MHDAIKTRPRSRGRRAVLIAADLEDPSAASALVNAAAAAWPAGALVMSHCESGISGGLDSSLRSFNRHYAVNVHALAAHRPAPGV